MTAIEINKGDKVLSTWSLNNDPMAQPVAVTDVFDDGTVQVGTRFYDHRNLVVIVQRPKAGAMAVRPYGGLDLGEDCVLAFDALLSDDIDGEIPSWIGDVAGMVLPDRE